MEIESLVQNMIEEVLRIESESKLLNSVTTDEDNETLASETQKISLENLRTLCLNSNVKVMLERNLNIKVNDEYNFSEESDCCSEEENMFKIKISEFNDQILTKIKKGVKSFKCNFCFKLHRSKWGTALHIAATHKRTSFDCDKKLRKLNCQNVKQKEVNEVWKQMWSKSVKDAKEKIICEFNDQIERKSVNGVTKYRCIICKKAFKSKFYATIHVASVHKKEKRFACELCNKTYASPDTLLLHVKTIHTNLSDFKCAQKEEERKTDIRKVIETKLSSTITAQMKI
ncbi:zinc finger protein 99-like protein [Leptotrombidium deliense]|uniref:Zinc finger protein 99-like protein n=1 Tax=Leptotrombidium deliense TaxID=299467 RepID=A0A443S0S1_9ACAR|nr:zinc finger protein 99-like protein [Leptotrombidium deliense]